MTATITDIRQQTFMTPPSKNTAHGAIKSAPNWLGFAPAIFVLLWATGFIGSRLSAPYAEPLSFLTIRFGIAAVLLAAIALLMRASWPDRRTTVQCLVTGALLHGSYLGFVFWAIWKGMPTGVSALIVGLQPLMTAILAGVMLSERITARHWTGLVIGLAGVGLVVWPKFTLDAAGITPLTLGAGMLAMLSITVGSIYQKRFMANVDLRTGNALQFTGAAILTGAGALVTESWQITWNGETVFAMAWLVLVLSIGAISLFYVMIRHGEISRITTLFYLVPGVTAVIGWLMFDEQMLPVQIAGMLVCAGAVMLVTRKS